MGTVTKSIGATGRDYTTVTAWEAAMVANLVTDANNQIGECYADTTTQFNTTASNTIDGHTTDATYNILLRTATGASFRDHADVRTNALKFDQSLGVNILKTSNYGAPLVISDNYVTVEGLQLSSRTDADSGQGLEISNANNILVKNCFIQSRSTSWAVFVGANTDVYKFFNCVILNRATSTAGRAIFFQQNSSASGCELTNCTLVRASDLTVGLIAIYMQYAGTAAGRIKIRNCAVYGFTDFCNNTSNRIHADCNYNASSTTIPTGANNQASQTYSSTQPFVGASTSAIDLRITDASDTTPSLTNLGGTFTDGTPDISGQSRPSGSAYDIGCWELIAAAALVAKMIGKNQAVNRASTF